MTHHKKLKDAKPMKNPVRPTYTVRDDCLEPPGLSVTEGPEVLRVTRQALNNLVSGKARISPEMAIRLSKAFGGTAEARLKMQLAYDLAQARKHESQIRVERYRAAELPVPSPFQATDAEAQGSRPSGPAQRIIFRKREMALIKSRRL